MDIYHRDTNPRHIFSIFLSYFLLDAYLALWFMSFELFDHFRTNTRILELLSNEIKTKADANAIRQNENDQ